MIGLALLAVLAAEPNPAIIGCRTTCGLFAPQATDCPALQRNENAIIKAYSESVHGWEAPQLCRALKGWTVLVNPYANAHGAWVQRLRGGVLLGVLGITDLDSRAVFVGLAKWEDSALAHELGHVFMLEMNSIRGGHTGWTLKGLCSAINKASMLKDDCEEPEYNRKTP